MPGVPWGCVSRRSTPGRVGVYVLQSRRLPPLAAPQPSAMVIHTGERIDRNKVYLARRRGHPSTCSCTGLCSTDSGAGALFVELPPAVSPPDRAKTSRCSTVRPRPGGVADGGGGTRQLRCHRGGGEEGCCRPILQEEVGAAAADHRLRGLWQPSHRGPALRGHLLLLLQVRTASYPFTAFMDYSYNNLLREAFK